MLLLAATCCCLPAAHLLLTYCLPVVAPNMDETGCAMVIILP